MKTAVSADRKEDSGLLSGYVPVMLLSMMKSGANRFWSKILEYKHKALEQILSIKLPMPKSTSFHLHTLPPPYPPISTSSHLHILLPPHIPTSRPSLLSPPLHLCFLSSSPSTFHIPPSTLSPLLLPPSQSSFSSHPPTFPPFPPYLLPLHPPTLPASHPTTPPTTPPLFTLPPYYSSTLHPPALLPLHPPTLLPLYPPTHYPSTLPPYTLPTPPSPPSPSPPALPGNTLTCCVHFWCWLLRNMRKCCSAIISGYVCSSM